MVTYTETPAKSVIYKVGDWICPCGKHNFKKRSTCYGCGKKKPYVPESGDWKCFCDYMNFRRNKICGKCKGPEVYEIPCSACKKKFRYILGSALYTRSSNCPNCGEKGFNYGTGRDC